MKKLFLILVAVTITTVSFAQDAVSYTVDSAVKPKASKSVDFAKLSNRANDHFMVQLGADFLSGVPDSISTKGLGRHLNIYFMLDKPFANSPRMSVGIGLGIGSSNIFLDKTFADIKAVSSATLPFKNVADTNHFKKYKFTTVFAELPVELRYSSNPVEPMKGWRAAIGAKVGTLLKAYTKGKNFQTKDGQSLYGDKYIVKESSKNFFNGTKLALTARVGYGIFSIHYNYRITSLLKDGAGPEMNTHSVGLTLSGL